MKKLKDDTKTNTEKVENQSKINNASYDMSRNNNEECNVLPRSYYKTTEYSLSISDNKLRPANSLMCNGISHKTTDSCYYY